MVLFSTDAEVAELQKGEELEGKLATSVDEALAHTVSQNDKESVEQGELLEEAINQGIHGFSADLLYEQYMKNFSSVRQIQGEKLIRLLTGYSGSYIEKNIKIPEFQKEIRKAMQERIENMKEKGLLDKDGRITDKGIEFTSMVIALQELERIIPKNSFGQKVSKKTAHYGEKTETRLYKKGDRYKDLAVRQTVRLAIKRGHNELTNADLKIYQRQSRGKITLVYGLDASASMKGDKIEMSKRAGIALAHSAIREKDTVGLVIFSDEIKDFVAPTNDFGFLINKITRVRAASQTNFKKMIEKAVELFPDDQSTKHLIILTDALPTVGEEPEEETLKAISLARSHGITVSLLGIQLDKKGENLAREIARLGEGRFYTISDTKNIDRTLLQDYYNVMAGV